MSTVTFEDTSSGRTLGDFRAKRTEAMPTSSLFGSSLEIKDKQQLEELKNIDLKEYRKSMLPKKTTENVELAGAKEVLEYNKQLLAAQNIHTTQARNLLNTLEERSKYFAVGVDDDPKLRDKIEASRTDKWMSGRELDHAQEINNVGYNGGCNYNHDRYMPKPPEHQYALIGNVLQTGGDFIVDRNVPEPFPPESYVNKRHGRRRTKLPKIVSDQPMQLPSLPSAMDLPPNIRHQFGTNVCKSVFADPERVLQSINEADALHHAIHRTRKLPKKPHSDVTDKTIDPHYDSLGLSLRQNVFPGYTYDHKTSHAKSVYTPEVYKGRQHDPDEWRYQRDELSTWAEQNVLRERMKKAWDVYLSA